MSVEVDLRNYCHKYGVNTFKVIASGAGFRDSDPSTVVGYNYPYIYSGYYANYYNSNDNTDDDFPITVASDYDLMIDYFLPSTDKINVQISDDTGFNESSNIDMTNAKYYDFNSFTECEKTNSGIMSVTLPESLFKVEDTVEVDSTVTETDYTIDLSGINAKTVDNSNGTYDLYINSDVVYINSNGDLVINKSGIQFASTTDEDGNETVDTITLNIGGVSFNSNGDLVIDNPAVYVDIDGNLNLDNDVVKAYLSGTKEYTDENGVYTSYIEMPEAYAAAVSNMVINTTAFKFEDNKILLASTTDLLHYLTPDKDSCKMTVTLTTNLGNKKENTYVCSPRLFYNADDQNNQQHGPENP